MKKIELFLYLFGLWTLGTKNVKASGGLCTYSLVHFSPFIIVS